MAPLYKSHSFQQFLPQNHHFAQHQEQKETQPQVVHRAKQTEHKTESHRKLDKNRKDQEEEKPRHI